MEQTKASCKCGNEVMYYELLTEHIEYVLDTRCIICETRLETVESKNTFWDKLKGLLR